MSLPFKKLKNRPGQGLLETVVAVGVIITGILASLALVIATVAAGRQTSDRLIASNLAWEGIEVVRNIRDSNYLAGLAWDSGLTGADSTAIAIFDEAANSWTLNFTSNSLEEESARLYRQVGIYRQDISAPPGGATNFFRLITIDPDPIDPEGTDFRKRVISEVRWLEKGVARSITAETKIFDWR